MKRSFFLASEAIFLATRHLNHAAQAFFLATKHLKPAAQAFFLASKPHFLGINSSPSR